MSRHQEKTTIAQLLGMNINSSLTTAYLNYNIPFIPSSTITQTQILNAMKFLTSVLFAASASAAVIASRQNGGGALQKGAQTLVLTEVGGIPGNECLTFRNNGWYALYFASFQY